VIPVRCTSKLNLWIFFKINYIGNKQESRILQNNKTSDLNIFLLHKLNNNLLKCR
jgi:hypothetical protein